ncbi:hypothetical protein CHS0354_037017 [Potamilus streckersoni]|uniref:Uncharacterized protein n=1 Tax=Potamilus streckersoni TaxID=2493646 RepID=A0AAE0SKN7_9BIVA|nr:hypothetical protein CHS0354_037017 [Potamilus streckersoni]
MDLEMVTNKTFIYQDKGRGKDRQRPIGDSDNETCRRLNPQHHRLIKHWPSQRPRKPPGTRRERYRRQLKDTENDLVGDRYRTTSRRSKWYSVESSDKNKAC